MKQAGMVRALDDLGRITLPIEMRKTMGIMPKDEVLITVENSCIKLEKWNDSERKELDRLLDSVPDKDIPGVINFIKEVFGEE